MTVTIPLTRGQETVVSDEDADLAGLRWHASRKVTYAKQNSFAAARGQQSGTSYRLILMHRVILSRMLGRELTRLELADHIDSNPLNNTRENLRLANHSQNGANRGKDRRNSTGLKGVTFDKQSGKYKAQIKFNRRLHYLGLYPTPQEAHEAYKQAAREHFGEFARFE